jgi:hypothetical protein
MRSDDVVLSELHSGGGEPDLDHVLCACGGQRGNEAVHVPKSLRTGPPASRVRAEIGPGGNVT